MVKAGILNSLIVVSYAIKQKRKGKIFLFECRVSKKSKDR